MEEVGNCDNGGGCVAGCKSWDILPENAFIFEVEWGRSISTVAMLAATHSYFLGECKATKKQHIKSTLIHAKEPNATVYLRLRLTLMYTRRKFTMANLGLIARVAKLTTLRRQRTSLRVVLIGLKGQMQVAGGIWADTVGGEFVLTFGVALCSISTASKLALQFLLVRSFMGIGEGFAMHSMNNIRSKWLSVFEKCKSIALLYGGMYLGSVTAPIFFALLTRRFGWLSVFYCLSSLGTFWVALCLNKAPLYWDLHAPKGLNLAKISFTCHNFEYQGTAHASELASCGIDVPHLNRPDRMQDHSACDRINSVKGAHVYSNIVRTVSPTYAQEVLTSQIHIEWYCKNAILYQ